MQKFTRHKIEEFLSRHATSAYTLDIGANKKDHAQHFPNRVTLDIDAVRNPDVIGDVQKLSFPDETFDCVVCSEVLEHVLDPAQAAHEMIRVLKKNGTLVLTTRFMYPVHDAPGDHWRFTSYGLEQLFSKMEYLETSTEGGPFYAAAVILQRVLFQTRVKGGKITKALVYGLALLLKSLDGLVIDSFGDIQRTKNVTTIGGSGVYLFGKK